MPTKPTGRRRGRPPGVKNKPKTIADFVLTNVVTRPPPPERKAPAAPQGLTAKMTPEERSEHMRNLRKLRGRGHSKPGYNTGRPKHLTREQFDALMAAIQPDIIRIKKKMADVGQLPDDPRAVKVLDKALETFLVSTQAKDISALGRLILDFTKAKPAAKVDVSVRTHADFLDELADDPTT